MKKLLLFMLIMLIPIAHAANTDGVLEAKQASLDVNANRFIIQMDAAINFTQGKGIDAAKLIGIRANFTEKLDEALRSTSSSDFNLIQNQMKSFSDDFRNAVKSNSKEFIDELRIRIGQLKYDEIKDKINAAAEKRKAIIEQRINEHADALRKYIDEQEKLGKNPSIHKIILRSFEDEQQKMNSTDFGLNNIQNSSSSSFWDALITIKDRISEEMRKVNLS